MLARQVASLRPLSAGLASFTNAAAKIMSINSPKVDADVPQQHSRSSSWRTATLLASVTSGYLMFSSSALPVKADEVKLKPVILTGDDEYKLPSTLKGIPKDITLYQYEVCPFCCKVKAVLDFYKLPYKVVEVNPLTKSELKWSTYKKVPVVKVDEEIMVGSSTIMSRIAAEVEAAGASKKALVKKGVDKGVSPEEETKWRKWVDERFVKILTANIYRSWDESLNTFKYITEQTNWSWGTREIARMSGAVLMWQVGKRLPKKYNIEGDLREALYMACDEFVAEIGPNRPFLGGASPNLADLSVYGVLKAVERTPTFSDAMAKSKIAPWYSRMNEAIGSSGRTSTEGSSWSLTAK